MVKGWKIGRMREAAVEILMNNCLQLSDDEFEAPDNQLADEFMVPVGPNCPPLFV